MRCIFGAVVGAGVFAATSVAMFSLAASAGSSSGLLGTVSNTVGGVTNTVTGTVNTVAGPNGVLCSLACSTTNQAPQAPQAPSQASSLSSSLPCVAGVSCSSNQKAPAAPAPAGTTSGTTQVTAPQAAAPPAVAGSHGTAGSGASPATVTSPGALAAGSLVQPPPPSITLPTATSGINFGKAPFLWPLFLGLDILGAGAVVLALRKTWSRPVAD